MNTQKSASAEGCEADSVAPRGGWWWWGVAGWGEVTGLIVVWVCEPEFRNLPHSYTWPLKKWTHSYT